MELASYEIQVSTDIKEAGVLAKTKMCLGRWTHEARMKDG